MEITFDHPTCLVDAILQYVSSFAPQEQDESTLSWDDKRTYKRNKKTIASLRQIKNVLIKNLSTDKQELMQTKYHRYDIDNLSTPYPTQFGYRSSRRPENKIRYLSNDYPIYAMRNYYVTSFSEFDADILIDRFNEQLFSKKQHGFKHAQSKNPAIVTCNCNCGRGFCDCSSCKPSRSIRKKGSNKDSFNDLKNGFAA